MKLRIRGDSLRLRLSQGELQTLAERGRVDDSIHFGAAAVLRYALVRDPGPTPLTAAFDGAAIEVRIAADVVARMVATDEVGVSGTQALGDGRELALLVEKDFKCVVPRAGEPDADGFPNPAASC